MFIVSASAMRSGSSWYLNLTNDLLVGAGYPDGRSLRKEARLNKIIGNEFMDIGKPKYTKLIQLVWASFSSGQFVVKTHSPPSNGTRMLAQLGQIKTTYIYRDPRDRLISLLEIGDRSRKARDYASPFASIKTFEDSLAHVKKARIHKELWEEHPQSLVVRYESLVADTFRELQRLSQHLGLTLSEKHLQDIIEKYNPEKLKTDENFTNYQKGRIGRYKDVLSEQQLARIHDVMKDDLVALGYSETN
jgi:Sulfotransferase domain